ncbi:hypothetical protein DY000_02014747 [Brassica cretica]|uniref:DUF287 domain-containing protein n=1 Tax=Brassica cretica TaxID=69181 RepID=A0ABQ7D0Y6_BRACR|nr:hypothetical protein DY000_02014747 [Brassica cretica]
MSPKTRLAEKKEKAGASEKKKNAGMKRKEAAAKRRAPSPPEHQGVQSSTPAAELPSQGDSEGTPRPVLPSQPQKSPTSTHAATEAENRVTSGSSTKSPSHRVDEQNGEEIGSNNRDSNAPEVAVDNDAPRTVERDDMTVEADRPAGFFFKPSDYGKEKLQKMKFDGSGDRLRMAVLYFLAREIISILEPKGYEANLLYEIMDEGTYEDLELLDDSDTPDIAADSWNKILLEPGSKILWPDLFEMDVRTRKQQEQAGGEEGGEAGGEAGVEAGGEAGRENLRELELKLKKRMDDGFALREETIRLLAARVKELEQDKIQRECWSIQFGEAETGYASGGRRRDKDGDEEAEMHGDKEGDEEAEKQGLDDNEADKEGEDNGDKDGDEAEAEKDGDEAEAEKDGEKQIEAEAEKDDIEERFDDDGDEQSTLQIMADTAERFEKAAAEKAAADKTYEVVDDDDALEKEGEVGVDDALEEAASVGVDDALENAASVADSHDAAKMPKRVPKRSHLLRWETRTKAEKDGEKQIEAEAEKDGEKDGEKQIEAEAEKLMQDTDERFDDDGDEQSTLQIMANTAERFEKAAAEKAAADKTNEVVDDDDALEKEGEVGVDDYSEEADSVGVDEMPKRVPKRSHLLRCFTRTSKTGINLPKNIN